MTKKFSVVRASLILLALALTLSGCSLFNQTTSSQSQPTDAQGTIFGRVVTAEQIGERNAPVNETSTFNAEQPRIYVVAEASQLTSGTAMFARWSRDGKPFEDSQEITANKDYQNTYVEFHLEPVQGTFDPGQYTVQLFVNGNPDKQANFTVR
ncbi:MAG TPA: hypothetical protein VFX76_15535 [Roseiflexaceae bacterium]|nr:hypothetical protein [Roseiflexaceae bacterium]